MINKFVTLTFILVTIYAQLFAQLSINTNNNGFSRIEEDFLTGHLSPEQKILNQFRYGFNQSELDEKYRGAVPAKCGTHLIKEYYEQRANFSVDTRDEIDVYLNRNRLQKVQAEKFTSPSGIFEVTYNTTGANSIPDTDTDNNGVPDYAEQTAEYFDYSWAHMIDTLGFDAPPLQNNVYQISFEEMGYYGYTTTVAGGFTRIVMNISYAGFPPNTDPAGNEIGAAKVTAYHEFKHAIQYGYNRWSSGTSNWFVELDATWAEDIGYNYVNDYYNYLGSSQIVNPGRALTNSDGYEDCLFLHYFTQKLGNDFAIALWKSINDNSFNDVFDHLDFVLQNFYSTNLNSELPEYYLWNAMTGNNIVPGVTTYIEASEYPTSDLCEATTAFPTLIDGCSIVQSGSNIINISAGSSDDFFSYELITTNTGFTVASVFKYLNGDPEVYFHSPDSEGAIFRVNQQMNNIEDVFLIPIVNTFAEDTYEYSFNLKAFKNADFTHTPLTDQESDQSLVINVSVETPFNIALIDSLRLHYSEDGTYYSSTTMSPTSNANEYTASIPPLGLEKYINYYFSIVDTAGSYLYYPADAPANSFTFFVGVDGVPPAISVNTVATHLSKYNFPYQLSLTASDNIALKEIRVEHKLNGGSVTTEVFRSLNDSLFIGSINFTNSDPEIGDVVEFRIIAEDGAQVTNTSYFPGTGFQSIAIVDGFYFESNPDKFVSDNTFPAVKDTITITDDITISDVDIYIEGTHAKFSDWEIKLRPPASSTKFLAKRAGLDGAFADAANPKILFDQQTQLSIDNLLLENSANAQGVFKPLDINLDDYNFTSAQGDWILSVSDKAIGNEGSLKKWAVILRGEIITSVKNEVNSLPIEYNLSQNYPNPFNPATTINYTIPISEVRSQKSELVSLRIYDTLGREVATLVNEAQTPGNYSVQWDASSVSRRIASGLYFYKLTHGVQQITKKMLLVK